MEKLRLNKYRIALSINTALYNQRICLNKKPPDNAGGYILNPTPRLFTPGVQQAGGMSERAFLPVAEAKANCIWPHIKAMIVYRFWAVRAIKTYGTKA